MYPDNPNFLPSVNKKATKHPHSYLFLDLRQETPEDYRVRSNFLQHEFPMKVYKSMYVVPKERFLSMIGKSPSTPAQSLSSPDQSHSTNDVSPSSLCPVDGRDFKHPNILAHHIKSHVNGLKCNLCGKILKNMSSLRKHLKRHAPQVPPNPAGPLPGRKAAPSGPPRERGGPLPGRKAAPP